MQIPQINSSYRQFIQPPPNQLDHQTPGQLTHIVYSGRSVSSPLSSPTNQVSILFSGTNSKYQWKWATTSSLSSVAQSSILRPCGPRRRQIWYDMTTTTKLYGGWKDGGTKRGISCGVRRKRHLRLASIRLPRSLLVSWTIKIVVAQFIYLFVCTETDQPASHWIRYGNAISAPFQICIIAKRESGRICIWISIAILYVYIGFNPIWAISPTNAN